MWKDKQSVCVVVTCLIHLHSSMYSTRHKKVNGSTVKDSYSTLLLLSKYRQAAVDGPTTLELPLTYGLSRVELLSMYGLSTVKLLSRYGLGTLELRSWYS